MNQDKYPMNYEETVNKLLKTFVEHDWDYLEKKENMQQEFLDNTEYDFHEAYREECENYDNGRPNIFDDDEGVYYIMGLLVDCENYFNSKEISESQKSEINESKYPMTYKEFEETLGELFIEEAPQMFTDVSTEDAKQGWKNFLKEQGPFHNTYKEYCEMYDDSSKRDVSKEEVFTKPVIGRQTYSMVQWVYF